MSDSPDALFLRYHRLKACWDVDGKLSVVMGVVIYSVGRKIILPAVL